MKTAATLLAGWSLFAQTGPSHYQLATEALGRKQYDVAAAEFRALVKQNPNLAEAHANLGTVYYAQGKYAEAAAAMRKALKLKPSLATAELFLGMSEARQGHVREAIGPLARGFAAASSDEWRLQGGLMLADLYRAVLDYDKALDVARALERAYKGDPNVLYLAYRLHSEQAARAVAALVKAAPDSARLHQITAEMLENDGDYPKAAEQYRKALELDPTLAGVRRALGVVLMHNAADAASREAAQRLFEEELRGNPGDFAAEYELGEILWLANKPDEAVRHFSRSIELSPNFTDALIAAGKAWSALGQPERALTLLEKAASIDPDNEVAHYRLAQAYEKLGRKPDAAREFARFRELRAAMESLRTLYRQVQGERVTPQRVE